MEHSQDLAVSFIRALGVWEEALISTISTVRVSTQRPVFGNGRRGFVDLEVVASTEDRSGAMRDHVVWIEVKHGSDLSGDQLETYLEAAQKEEETPRLLLLASRYADLDRVLPDFVRRSWQEVAASLKRAEPPADSSASSWLWRQYLRFLDEEELMDEDRLSIESVYAMNHYLAVDRAVESIVRRAIPSVEERWGPQTEGSKRVRGLGLWQHFEWNREVPGWRHMEFMVVPGVHLSDPTSGYVFFAGLTYAISRDPFPDEADSTFLLPGFEVWRDDWGRRMRTLRPETLLQSDDPDTQAKTLADWIVGTFQSVESAFRDPVETQAAS